MPETQNLRPADPDDFRQALAHALQFDGRKRSHHADGLAARIAADHLAKHLEQSGFVIMKKLPRAAHSASGHHPKPALPLKD
jgi:hypothetical protein